MYERDIMELSCEMVWHAGHYKSTINNGKIGNTSTSLILYSKATSHIAVRQIYCHPISHQTQSTDAFN